MLTLQDIGVSAFINIASAFAFLLAFTALRLLPINERVYFPKWHMPHSQGRTRPRPSSGGNFLATFFSWIPLALSTTEADIIEHAGLDSAVFIRVYLLGIKIFLPVTVLALLILLPVNITGGALVSLRKELGVSDTDKLSISNLSPQSTRFFIHVGMEYLLTMWICYVLYEEYHNIASMRLHFLASRSRSVEQFSVVVRNVPHVVGQSISNTVGHFFQTKHPNSYIGQQAVYNAKKYFKLVTKRNRLQNGLDYNQLLFERNPDKRPTTKTRFFGLWGKRIDSIQYYKQQLKELDKKILDPCFTCLIAFERQRILNDPKSMMPVAFISFNSRWSAAVCAQTLQSRDPTLWLTKWAPEPRDVYWRNLAIPLGSLRLRKLLVPLAVLALVFIYMVPTAFVQFIVNFEALETTAPFLKPLIKLKLIKSLLVGFLPALIFKIFLWIVPKAMRILSKIEGHIALSTIEREAAAKCYYFMLLNVFLGTIVAGPLFERLDSFLHQSPTRIVSIIGASIPKQATFFITYIMIDGWAGIASEIFRLMALVIFHLKNMFLVKTERDREQAMDPGSVDFPATLPSLQLYFLLGIAYAVVAPILLPFILVFFAFAYFIYRHQVINVYNQQYESSAAFWPHIHKHIIASLLISQLLLLGVLSTKRAATSAPLLVALPLLTLIFHKYCKNRFEPIFRKYPLEEALAKDTMERIEEPNLDINAFLADAYRHPIFQLVEAEEELVEVTVDEGEANFPGPSEMEADSSSGPSEITEVIVQSEGPSEIIEVSAPSPSH